MMASRVLNLFLEVTHCYLHGVFSLFKLEGLKSIIKVTKDIPSSVPHVLDLLEPYELIAIFWRSLCWNV